jgi:hypothetical protein
MKQLGIAGALAFAAALAACGRTWVVPYDYRSGVREQFHFVAGQGSVRTVVVGNPFPEDKPTVEGAVTEALRQYQYGPITEFTTGPGHPKTRDYRIVVLFNPAVAVSPQAMCGDAGALAADGSSAGRLGVFAAFCYQNETISSVRGATAPVRSVRDAQVAELMYLVMFSLFPVHDPHRSDRDCRTPTC